jgi:predicted TIM-barrel fold metal-dependent hydrolase
MIIDGYCTIGTERQTRLLPDELLKIMDNAGVDRTVIAPQDREIAVDNRVGNDRVLDAAKKNERLIPACTVNPWYGARAVEELKRCANAGIRMLVLSSALQGFTAGDELTSELMQCAAALKICVYMHTGSQACAPSQVFYAALTYPDVNFIMGHCGSTDYAWDMGPILKDSPKNLWYELSRVRPWCIPIYGRIVPERLIWASDSPLSSMGWELSQANQFWPIKDHPETYGGTLAGLLGIR